MPIENIEDDEPTPPPLQMIREGLEPFDYWTFQILNLLAWGGLLAVALFGELWK